MRARFYKHFLLEGRRITPTSTSLKTSASSALIKATIDGKMCVGEVMAVFQHAQPRMGETQTFVEMRWMIQELLSPVEGYPWAPL